MRHGDRRCGLLPGALLLGSGMVLGLLFPAAPTLVILTLLVITAVNIAKLR